MPEVEGCVQILWIGNRYGSQIGKRGAITQTGHALPVISSAAMDC